MIASILIVLVIASVALAAYTIAKPFDGSVKSNVKVKSVNGVNSFDTCIAAGYPVQETAPPRCMDSKGNTYVDFSSDDYANCVSKGGKIKEEQIVCVQAPCNPIVSCTIEGNTYIKN